MRKNNFNQRALSAKIKQKFNSVYDGSVYECGGGPSSAIPARISHVSQNHSPNSCGQSSHKLSARTNRARGEEGSVLGVGMGKSSSNLIFCLYYRVFSNYYFVSISCARFRSTLSLSLSNGINFRGRLKILPAPRRFL